jgi:hypothetical protein
MDLSPQDGAAQLLGYEDYQAYLLSPLWKRIKRRVLKRDRRICQCCKAAANIVHHRRYTREVLAGGDDSQLASICEGCHNTIHEDGHGAWRSVEETDRLLVAGPAPCPSLPEAHVGVAARSCRQIGHV